MDRRDFLMGAGTAFWMLAAAPRERQRTPAEGPTSSASLTLFLCGDVMTGRGIDQVLPHPCDPRIYESYVKDARRYVELAEARNGPIPRPIDFSYIWGEALEELARVAPDVKIINLETAVTRSQDHWPDKGINYRMHPQNLPCISAAEIDCCALANNHVLDWGYSGLAETLESLRAAGLATAGAGSDRAAAQAPAVLEVTGKGRVIVFSFGSQTSGIPSDWAATPEKAGVDLLADLSDETVAEIAARVGAVKRRGDLVVASIHWGSNWGYRIPAAQRRFAHRLIDRTGVDVVHGHSSHHPRAIEVYRDRPILYGCGDFLNDYEGISGYEEFRSDLALMYFVTCDAATGRLTRLAVTPTQIRRFQVRRASRDDALWMRDTLNREGRELGTRLEPADDGTLELVWEAR